MVTPKNKTIINIVVVSFISILMIVGLSIPLGFLPSIGKLFFPGNGIWITEEEIKSQETISLPFLSDDVTVYRDTWGIPHIFGTNESDIAFALGYVHAQDRLLQMDLARRLTTGRLAEIMGESMIEQDKFNLNMMKEYWSNETYYQLLESNNPQDSILLQILLSYSNGINYYLEKTKILPIEFTLLGFRPDPWTPKDTLGFIKYMSEMLTWDYADFNNMMLLEGLGNNNYTELFEYPLPFQIPICPNYGNYSDESLSPSISHIENEEIDSQLISIFNNFLEQTFSLPSEIERINSEGFVGSNNWVVSGNKSATGKPILCNDMHLSYNLPGIWYESHLVNQKEGEDFNIYGFFLAGVPYPIVGHNNHVGWGMTNTGYDVIDWYYYDAVNSTHYIYNGEAKKYQLVTYSIPVKSGETISYTIKLTVDGPVFYDLWEQGEIPSLENKIIACRWIGQTASNEGRAIYNFAHAKNRAEFNLASRDFSTPAQNIVYADIYGNIGIRPTGKVPIRDDTAIPSWHRGNGTMPYNGSNGEGKWIDYVPFDDLPHTENPSQGYLASANQIVAGPEYFNNYYLQNILYTSPGYRAQRINDYLTSKSILTIDDMIDLQLDIYSTRAESFIPHLLNCLVPLETLSTTQSNAMDELIGWDYNMDVDSSAATIFAAWIMKFRSETFDDELSEANAPNYPKDTVLQKLMITEPNSLWFDNINTEQIETRDDIMLLAFEKTVAALMEYYNSDDVETWIWGDLHQVIFPHLTGITAFGKGPYPIGGSGYTVNPVSIRNIWKGEGIVQSIGSHGASERMIIDFSNLNNSLSIIPSGQRGISNSKHYTDQLELYLEGKYHPQYFAANSNEKFLEIWIETVIYFKVGGN
ncbi:MAG: penicillin acylase family protein [Candidatus Thorarchaeota archaeon]